MLNHIGHAGRLLGPLMIFRGLVGIGILVLVIILIVRLVQVSKREHFHSGKGTYSPFTPLSNAKALEILAERYAKGEINDDEYKQKKEALTKE